MKAFLSFLAFGAVFAALVFMKPIAYVFVNTLGLGWIGVGLTFAPVVIALWWPGRKGGGR